MASTVVVLRGVADPMGALAALTGCPQAKPFTGFPLTPAVKGVDVDAVAAAAGRSAGWLFVPPGVQASTRVWLGDDLVDLASAVGQPVVAVGPIGEVWLGGRSGATRWVPIATPAGRTAWVMTGDEVVGDGTCGPWIVPTLIDGQRSVTCTGVALPSCLQLLSRARVDVPGIEYAAGDVTVSIAACRQRSLDCLDRPAVAVATPQDWPVATAALRAATSAGATGPFAPTAQSLLPDVVLDLLARPSLPLPTAGAQPTGGACSHEVVGPLRGSPWDPRVAWVGERPVVWPPGTSAWFLPGAVVEVIGRTVGTTARGGDRVLVTGTLDATGRFAACSMTLAPVAAGGPVAPGAGVGPAGVGEVPAVTPGPPDGRGTGS